LARVRALLPELSWALGSGLGGAVSQLGQKIEQHDTLVEGSRLAADAATLDAYNKTKWQKFKQNADPKDPDYHNLAS
jgi:hypothetical protein